MTIGMSFRNPWRRGFETVENGTSTVRGVTGAFILAVTAPEEIGTVEQRNEWASATALKKCRQRKIAIEETTWVREK